MKYYVNDSCIGCGMCCGICPKAFHLNDNGFAEAIDENIDETDLQDAENAKLSCPVGAIEERK